MDLAIVIIGPSGSGKSTLGQVLARELGRDFVEGDEHHPVENRAKIASGVPLTDEDRAPFLASVGRAISSKNGGVVASCSALRRAYRDQLRSHHQNMLFVWLDVDREELRRRLHTRSGHFMPASLLSDQLANFQPPEPDEIFLRVDGKLPVEKQVCAVRRQLFQSPR
jgi:gluconokinase